jgi:hypothetical protein
MHDPDATPPLILYHLTNYFSALDTLLAAGDSRVRALYRAYTTPV